MNAYDSIERGVVDEGERRRPRTFTLTQLLVACVAVCVCSIAATTAVHRLSQEEPPDIEPRPDPPEPLDEPFRKAATTVVNTHQGPSCGLTMILYDVPSDIARNILDITFHT